MRKLALFLFVVGAFITAFSSAAAAQPQYVREAFQKAALPADANGTWKVRAVVNIHKPNGETIEGSGYLDLDGNTLAGDLALKPTGGFFIKGQKMYLNILKYEPMTVRVRHDFDGKPFLGRPASVANIKSTFREPYSQGTVKWDNDECAISIFLTPEQVKGGKPGIRKPPPEQQTPIGARYHVTGLMEVTNAEDGVLDNTCEIYGTVSIGLFGASVKSKTLRSLFTLIPQDAMKGFKLNFDNNIYIDRYYDQEHWNWFNIEGIIQDQDGGVVDQSDDDLLWLGGKGFRMGGVNDPVGTVKDFVVPGDRDSENAEVYVKLTLVEKLYKKP